MLVINIYILKGHAMKEVKLMNWVVTGRVKEYKKLQKMFCLDLG